MTRTYTAADFANAQFAEHADGRVIARCNPEGTFAWENHEVACKDEEMAAFGWVPVPTESTITESQFSELSEDLKNRTTILACALERVGIKIVPDPEPTNAEKLEQLYSNWSQSNLNPPFGEWADSVGVKAPEEWGQRMSELADIEYFKELCAQSVPPSDYVAVRKEFGEMIKKIILTAKREALTDLCDHFDRLGEGADSADRWAWEWSAEDEIRDYIKSRYPTPGAQIKERKVE